MMLGVQSDGRMHIEGITNEFVQATAVNTDSNDEVLRDTFMQHDEDVNKRDRNEPPSKSRKKSKR